MASFISSARWPRTLERMAFQVTSTSINPNHVKRSTYMRSRNPVVLRLMLAAVVLVPCSCTVLAPGADRVKFTQNAADVAGCKAVGKVSAPDLSTWNVEIELRNRTVGLDGNTVFRTKFREGVAYRCP